MELLPIHCDDNTDRSCRGFREELGVVSGGKGICTFELNGFCGADKRDFRVSQHESCFNEQDQNECSWKP
jgi:hypothetical protein